MKYENLVNNILGKIVSNAHPEQVVLFGSFASGKPGKDSDLDLLIVKNSDKRRDERDREIRAFLKDVVFPMDIFVYTPEEAKILRNTPGSFLKKVMDTGKILYEKK